MALPGWLPSRSFFAKAPLPALLPRGLDFHSHILPGIDDGMADYADAKDAVQQLQTMGFTGAVLTPHIYRDVFNNNAVDLRQNFKSFTTRLAADGVDFPLHLAAEYFTDEHFLDLIARDDLLFLPVGRERWVLLEFSYIQETPYAGACLSALVAGGYRPVIAHVERYRFVAQNPSSWLAIFANHNAILQGDIGSLAGQYGEDVKRSAHAFLKTGKIDIWGTDLHHPRQVQKYIAPGLAKLQTGRTVQRLNPLLDPITIGIAA